MGEQQEKVISRLKPDGPRHFLKQWRKFRRLTQEQLAGRLDMSNSSISQLETGKQGYTQDTLEALADALSCQPGDLLMRDPLAKDAPWSILDTLKPESRRQALIYLRALKEAEAEEAA